MSGVFIAGAVVGAAVNVYSANKQAGAAKQQAAAQREATAAQQKMAGASAAKERLAQIRQGRMKGGAITAAAGASGMGQSTSGVAGSISSIGSQTASNIGQINVQEGFAELASRANQRAADAQVKQAKWQAIGQVGQTIFNQSVSRIN